MQGIARWATVVAGCVALLGITPSPAQADIVGNVNCAVTPNDPQCTVEVVYTGGGGDSGGGEGGNVVCKVGGQVVDCHNEFGWLSSDGCYYGKDGGGFLGPNYWIKSCFDPVTDTFTSWGTVWLASPPGALGVLTQRAVDRLTMPKPVIAASPALTTKQFVHVPVWWWVQPGWWQTHTANASAGGLTITAKAVPKKITWYAGDGTSTVCTGPGAQWTAATNPTAPSPTCGHTYTKTSAASLGGKVTVRAVATWAISWSGGGMSGTEPSITTTTTATVTVTELRAVVTG